MNSTIELFYWVLISIILIGAAYYIGYDKGRRVEVQNWNKETTKNLTGSLEPEESKDETLS